MQLMLKQMNRVRDISQRLCYTQIVFLVGSFISIFVFIKSTKILRCRRRKLINFTVSQKLFLLLRHPANGQVSRENPSLLISTTDNATGPLPEVNWFLDFDNLFKISRRRSALSCHQGTNTEPG